VSRNAPLPIDGSTVSRFVLDSNIYDELEADPDALDALHQLVDAARIEILETLTQLDELLATPDEKKRDALFGVRDRLRPRRIPATQVYLHLAESGLDKVSEFSSDYAALQGPRVRDTADIAIATAAKWAGAWFVSADKPFLRRLKKEVPTIWCLTYQQFAATVRELAAERPSGAT
jgi:hypothetical protein